MQFCLLEQLTNIIVTHSSHRAVICSAMLVCSEGSEICSRFVYLFSVIHNKWVRQRNLFGILIWSRGMWFDFSRFILLTE